MGHNFVGHKLCGTTREKFMALNVFMKKVSLQSSLVVRWLGLGTFTAKSQGLIPGWGIKFLQAKKEVSLKSIT